MTLRRWVLAFVALAVVAAGAGFTYERLRPPSDGELRAAHVVVDDYLDAYARQDGDALCATFTDELRVTIGDGDAAACPDRAARRGRVDAPAGRPRSTVAADGHDVRAVVDWPSGEGVALELEREDGDWRLLGDAWCVTPSCNP